MQFKNLWKSGFDAHLDIESHAGQAWVGIHVRLGHEPGPAQQHQHFPSHLDRKPRDGPSRQRRRARRAAARAERADPVEQSGQDEPVVEAEGAPRKAAENVMLETEEAIVEANKVTEENKSYINCDNSLILMKEISEKQLSLAIVSLISL